MTLQQIAFMQNAKLHPPPLSVSLEMVARTNVEIEGFVCPVSATAQLNDESKESNRLVTQTAW